LGLDCENRSIRYKRPHLVEHAQERYCPIGKYDNPLPRRLSIADLAGCDPATSPQSPQAGGCCDPPKVT